MSEEAIHNPHDHFFKETLGRRAAAAKFFQAYLTPGLVAHLDWERLERQEASFVDETLRQRHADLLYAVPWKGQRLFIYCLFEHQTSQDPLMAFRLIRYMVRIWDSQIKAEPGRQTLSPIVPIVLHQSDQDWKVSRQFRSLFEPPEEGNEELRPYLPDFAYELVDLAEWPVEQLRGDVLVRAILTTMKHARRHDWLERFEELARLLDGALREHDVSFVRTCLEYLIRTGGDIDLKRFRRKLEEVEFIEIRDDAMTLADQLIQEGRQEGRNEGRREGERTLLSRQLTRRFGPLPQWAIDKLQDATIEDLEKCSERVLDAPSLGAVFED